MRFESDDLDWAMGELLKLFSNAHRCIQFPHDIDPLLFYEAMAVVNAQPFEVRGQCLTRLLTVWTPPSRSNGFPTPRRRHGNTFAH